MEEIKEKKKIERKIEPFSIDCKLVLETSGKYQFLYAVLGNGIKLLIPKDEYNGNKHYLITQLIKNKGVLKL